MALISKASLLMVPSTYEPGKLYNVLPSGNRAPDSKGGAGYDQTRADFDFDRGSNAAATRINSSGLIEKYRENVLLQSNAFSASPWSLSSATISGGQSGYDGSNDAWIFTTSVSGAALARSFSETGIVTFSVYAKAGSVNGIRLRIDTNSDANGFFDLVNGTSTSSGDIDTNIENIGSGWYRCSVSHNAVGPVKLQFFTTDGTSSYDNGSIYIQSAQLETGLVATDYLNSTSTTGKAGVLIDLPRINYDANGENGALLLEPSRQQLITQSEYFASSDWIKTNSTITNNSVVSPEGLQNAATHTNTAASSVFLYQYLSASGTTFTCSVFAKKNTNKYLGITMTYDSDGSKRYQVIFNLEDGTFAQQKDTASTLTNRDYDIEDYGNGWYRCSITSTGTNGRPYMVLQNSNIISTSFNAATLDWSDATIGSAYYYGAQCEDNASYATSYIPNHGTSGGVTRAADSCSVTGASDVIGQTEGTLFAEINLVDNNTDSMFMTIGDGTSNNRIHIGYDKTSDWIYCNVKAAGLQQALITSSSPSDGIKKIAVAYKQNDYIVYINGVSVGADTNANVPTLTRIDIGGYFSAGFEHSVKQNLLFNERLTNAELATLTTL